jgi:hypothetical protein
MMFVRRHTYGDGLWWVSVKLGGPEWHSYGHKTARAAMLHGSTLAALWNTAEHERIINEGGQ